jgi:hypothetical protein
VCVAPFRCDDVLVFTRFLVMMPPSVHGFARSAGRSRRLGRRQHGYGPSPQTQSGINGPSTASAI